MCSSPSSASSKPSTPRGASKGVRAKRKKRPRSIWPPAGTTPAPSTALIRGSAVRCGKSLVFFRKSLLAFWTFGLTLPEPW
eukprot:14898099-Alexandrium_andersonii.AAC.1